jgi:hypothetical protein
MSSYATSYKSLARGTERKTYARVTDRAFAFVFVFLVAISAAAFGDRLGLSLEFITYAVAVLIVVLLGAAPAVSKFFEWKRAITGVAIQQHQQLRAITVSWTQYAERLSELEALRAQILHQSNRARLAELMTARPRVKPNIGLVNTDAMIVGGGYQIQQVFQIKGGTAIEIDPKDLQGALTKDLLGSAIFHNVSETGSARRFRGTK